MGIADPSWVRPFWLERQLDPASADFVPAAASAASPAVPANVTHRSWTLVGTLGTYERAAVDPRGMVTPLDGGWSLDWWVGAEDRWHLPSREAAVRQRALDGAPVVETAMRVPGGDVVARAYAAHVGRDLPGSPAVAVVEVRNDTPVPVALALVVRPVHPLGAAKVDRIAVEGTAVSVNGRLALLLARPAARVALSTGADGDVAATVLAGGAVEPSAEGDEVRCPAGAASAALVMPLPHTAVVRVVLPLVAVEPPVRRRSEPAEPRSQPAVPPADAVARGWAVQAGRASRIEVPDDAVRDVVATATAHLLGVHAGEDLAWWPDRHLDLCEAAQVVVALASAGFVDEAAQVVGTLGDRQALDGTLVGEPGRMDANGAALVALGRHAALTGDASLVDAAIGPVAKAVHWIEKRRTGRRARRDVPGLVPAGPQPPYVGDPMVSFRDDAWSLAGLDAVAPALAAAGQPEVADDTRRFATSLRATLVAELAAAAEVHGGVVPAGPSAPVDDSVVAVVDLLGPFGPFGVADPLLAATLDHLDEHLAVGPALRDGAGRSGLSPALTLRLALAELEAGEVRAWDRFRWVLDQASPTAAWPTVLHPRTGGGTDGVGHDPVVSALVVLFLRHLLVRDGGAGELVVASVVPESWWGGALEVHDAPTAAGRFGMAVRWHGERPALLWELDPHPGVDADAVTIRAPGLDPAWVGAGARGEALLAPVRPAAADGGGSFS